MLRQLKSFALKVLLVSAAASMLAAGCQRSTPVMPPPPTQAPVATEAAPSPAATSSTATATAVVVLPVVEASPGPQFAVFQEDAVEVVPAVDQPEIAADLSNVDNAFVLSSAQMERLAQNGFVVTPGTEKEFFQLYEKARYDNKPIFVSSDALLHAYHLLFDKVLRTVEREQFIPLLKDLNQAVLAEAEAQYQVLKNTPWEEAARRTVAYFAVGSKLLDPAVQAPDYAADLVQAELELIEAASGILPSPIFPGLEFGEDYTQYIPRGHYTLSDDLKAYFKSMMWYGRMTFRLRTDDPEVGRAETRMAVLATQALRNASVDGAPAMQAWQALYAPTVFFVGRSDDLTIQQYSDVFQAVYGDSPEAANLTDEANLDTFITLADQLPPPKILGIVIADTDDEIQTTKGMRFMGQRFVPDAYIFRQLMYRNVGTPQDRRGLPKGLDIPAAMGSERAYQILDEMGETDYANYPEQMEKMRAWTSGLSAADWTETLYNTWLYSFYPLLDVPGEGHPAFMHSAAWLDKQLNTVLGSWAELKHDTILYAKQAYAELGGGPPPPPPLPPRGYVEPVPEFYARLAGLTAMTLQGLDERGLLGEQDAENLQRLEALATSLQAISEKELANQALSEEEYELIRYIGGELEHLTMAAADTVSSDAPGPSYMEEEPQAAVIADVATDPGDPAGPVVLEEGVGRINEIHVVVPVIAEDGTTHLQVAKGGVFSYYEFPWPASDRLTDEKWREMLASGQAPAQPEWMASFMTAEGEYSQLTSAIHQAQGEITYLYWGAAQDHSYLPTDLLAAHQVALDALNEQGQYMGHQLASSAVLSVDMQSPQKAVVTVREVWQDTLYAYGGEDFPSGENPLDERGPYTLETTYVLELVDGRWTVTGVSYANQPPEW
jgi:hypothetical protein